jgi:hypothetical protein
MSSDELMPSREPALAEAECGPNHLQEGKKTIPLGFLSVLYLPRRHAQTIYRKEKKKNTAWLPVRSVSTPPPRKLLRSQPVQEARRPERRSKPATATPPGESSPLPNPRVPLLPFVVGWVDPCTGAEEILGRGFEWDAKQLYGDLGDGSLGGEEGVSTLALGSAAALPGPIGPSASSCLSGGFVDLGYLAVNVVL